MERKEIFIVIAVCAAVCLLIAGIRYSSPEDETSINIDSLTLQTGTRAPTTTTNYWDRLHKETETTAAVTDEEGNPVTQEQQTSDVTAPAQSETAPAESDLTTQPAEPKQPVFTAETETGAFTEPTSRSNLTVQTAPSSTTSRMVIVLH